MRTICQKSGVELWKSNYFLGFDLADEHPIFKAKSQLILTPKYIHRFMFAESEIEKRLIFLAVLNTTYLVHFQTIATPSKLTMEKYFLRLMPLAQWVRFAEFKLAKIITFPQYVIRQDNSDLSNIGAWIASIEDIREKINRKELERDKSAALHEREMEIKRELGEAIAVGKAFTPKLAKWSLDLCDITPRHPDFNRWMKVLCCPVKEAWIAELEDFMEIRDLLYDNLPFLEENPQAISVMHQINTLISENRKGFTEFSLFDETKSEAVDFEILEDGTEHRKVTKINQQLQNVPKDMPLKEQFKNKFEFLIAKAKWDLAQARKKDNPPEPEEPNEENTRPNPPTPPAPISEESV
jgi:hypothetical protein